MSLVTNSLSYAGVICAATRRGTVESGLAWLAEERPYDTSDVPGLLAALVAAERDGLGNASDALERVTRQSVVSDVDTAARLAETELIVSPVQCEAVIAELIKHSSRGTLSSVGPAALQAALTFDSRSVEIFGQIAGLSWRDLRRRAIRSSISMPSSSSGPWTPGQLRAIIGAVGDVIGSATTDGVAPVEFRRNGAGSSGWGLVDEVQTNGVSYGTLLSQRLAGGAWGAHRNRTATTVRADLANELMRRFDDAGVLFWSAVGNRGRTVNARFLYGQVGRVGQLAIVTRTKQLEPRLAILVAVAHDGGSARKTASTIVSAPERLSVPSAVVLAGQGWAARSETAQLARAFDGRVFTDRSIDALVELALLP